MPRPVPNTVVGLALKFPRGANPTTVAIQKATPPAGFAKQSTRYLANGEIVTQCTTDRSQYGTNMTAGTSSVFENASTRFNYSHPRTILLKVSANSTDQLNLWRHGTAGNLELMRFQAGGSVLEIFTNNTSRLTLSVTGLTASRTNLVIAWVSEANPDTTGAADAVLSWLMWWNLDSGDFNKASVTHPTKSLESTTAVWGAGDALGTNAFTGVILGVQYENRAMSPTEIAADWVASRTAPTTQVVTDHQGLPVLSSSPIGTADYFHGPAAAWICDATRRMYRRTHSILWNDLFRITTDFTQVALDSNTDPWIRGAPNATGYRMHLTYFRGYPAPVTASHLWVRAHVRSWVTAGVPVPTAFRLYSFNRPPGIGGLAGVDGDVEPFDSYQVTETRVNSDSGVPGWWIFNALVPIARGTAGLHENWTYLALAIDLDPNDLVADDSKARVRIEAINVVPVYREQSGVLGFGGDGGS